MKPRLIAFLLAFLYVAFLFGQTTDSLPVNLPQNMVFIQGGTFKMGDVMGDKDFKDETVHTVRVGNFYLGKTELTFRDYDAYCTAVGIPTPGDMMYERRKYPVADVSWLDAVKYCNWLSEQQHLRKVYSIDGETVTADWDADGYRLPTEAEWEYAAREGGKKVRFGNGKNIADSSGINFDSRGTSYKMKSSNVNEFRHRSAKVAAYPPNSLGLYEMSGNVWEWCWDWYGRYPQAQETNGLRNQSCVAWRFVVEFSRQCPGVVSVCCFAD
jgi:formylglycine-generating enzyme required for sulfatase activity